MPVGVYNKTEEHKKHISESLRRYFVKNPMTEEWRRHISERVVTDEWKAHISEGKMGCALSVEHRQHISEGNMGRVVSKKTRQKITGTLKSHAVSGETRLKIGKASKETWGNRTPEAIKKHNENGFHSPEARRKQQAFWNSMTPEQRQGRMSQCCHSPESRRKQREYLASLTPEQMMVRMLPFVKASLSPDVRKRRSETMRRQFRDGERLSPTRWGWTETQTGIKVRSSWEATICNLLTSFGIEWLYEPEVFDLGFACYRPDLYLPGYELWIEIKGYWRDGAQRKVGVFSEMYPLLVIDNWKYQQIIKDSSLLPYWINTMR